VVAEAGGASRRGGRLASLVEEVLDAAGEARSAIEGIIVGLGPGSAAGIRSTLAFAMGWGVARGISVTGVSSVWGLAARAREEGFLGRMRVVVRGPAGKIYTASFQVFAEAVSEVAPLELVAPDRLKDVAGGWDHLVGPEVSALLGTERPRGDGLTGGPAVSVSRLNLTPTGGALGWLVSQGYGPPDQPLEPLSLMPPHFVKAPPPRRVPER